MVKLNKQKTVTTDPPKDLASNPSLATNWLCVLGQVLSVLWALTAQQWGWTVHYIWTSLIRCPLSSRMFSSFSLHPYNWPFQAPLTSWDSEKLTNLLKTTEQEFKPTPWDLSQGPFWLWVSLGELQRGQKPRGFLLLAKGSSLRFLLLPPPQGPWYRRFDDGG